MVILMVIWKHKLNLKDIFTLYENKKIDLNEFSNKIADVIEGSHFFSDYVPGLKEIVEEFRDLSNNDGEDRFSVILESLYDWADGHERSTITTTGRKETRTCWIEVV